MVSHIYATILPLKMASFEVKPVLLTLYQVKTCHRKNNIINNSSIDIKNAKAIYQEHSVTLIEYVSCLFVKTDKFKLVSRG